MIFRRLIYSIFLIFWLFNLFSILRYEAKKNFQKNGSLKKQTSVFK
ncbi:hypothetical protein LEP1GSC151_2433 [Leptospira interrogans serovar Grippotyphosa str. LT2186]|uniref:Uncharacterized protein n=1 Tax=Leptospira interrogans serovar Grippotyphosa str. LT2186 TaxID=1001599 RepID=M3I1U0_LEPIR|nr:hypothetical protein LEP1GSC151_2433 [Leptospira interrogans serovar Grippotyphosa str. LT2186]